MESVLDKLLLFDDSKRWFVAIAGVPGSGKTTVAGLLADKVNKKKGSGHCVALPMDGFHLYKKELSQMADPDEAFERRGAHWTFDSGKLYEALKKAKDGSSSFPGFNHADCDPEPDKIEIPASCRLLIVEGNYLLFKGIRKWRRLNALFDLSIFLQCPQDVANTRLTSRHMAAWGVSEEEAAKRAKGSDYVNALLIRTTKDGADVVLQSTDISV